MPVLTQTSITHREFIPVSTLQPHYYNSHPTGTNNNRLSHLLEKYAASTGRVLMTNFSKILQKFSGTCNTQTNSGKTVWTNKLCRTLLNKSVFKCKASAVVQWYYILSKNINCGLRLIIIPKSRENPTEALLKWMNYHSPNKQPAKGRTNTVYEEKITKILWIWKHPKSDTGKDVPQRSKEAMCIITDLIPPAGYGSEAEIPWRLR